ncbi:uncharacterized protein LOC124208476 isoform X2 [Daphnia pulex]|uniref:uncharacterized protein LOC124208476 isoform X2 n=1 Tax=Daphnia pulex TaxID=6669 RepID=UPI001EDE1362|nr:uncharacterized protein LOC124208476 isoform X2 [Daphnia pulex]
MAAGELNLFVAGIQQKIVVEKSRTREPDCYKLKLSQGSRTKEAYNRKPNIVVLLKTAKKRPTELLCETESNCSSSSVQEETKPVIWVDIVKKFPSPEVETLPVTKPTSSRKLPSVWMPRNSRSGILPEGFQIYIQKNLNLIADVQTAKRRRSDNRDIFRTEQEDDVNWTSNAPRPSEWLLKPPLQRKKKRNRKSIKFEKWLQLPSCGLQGIHLEGREPRKTNPLQPGPRNQKPAKQRQIRNCSPDYEMGWVYDGEKVTFQLINQGKQKNKSEKKRRRRRIKTKKGKKVPKQSSSKGARSLRNPDTSVLDENVFTGYDANNLSDPMREMDLSDGFPLAKTEDEPVFLDPKLNGAFINEVGAQPPIEVCEEAVKNKQHSVEDLEESLRNLQVEDDHNGNNDVLYQVEGTVAVEDMSWLYFPRAGNNFGARFELPIDLRKLKTMTPLEYLSQYVVATRCRQRLNDVVFERHATESKLSTEKLFLSLTEILGFHLDSQAEEKLSELIDLVSVSELTREQFAGIGALAERIGRSGISRRDDLELADFDLLHKKMSYLEMSQFLRRLFLFISEIEDLV